MEYIFYFISLLMIIGSVNVVISKNPVYSVLWLIFTFVICSILFLFLEEEYMAMLMLIVYVGAISVLFLFVVMMVSKNKNSYKYDRKLVSLSCIVIFSIIMNMFFILRIGFRKFLIHAPSYPIENQREIVKSIGNILFTDFFLPFQIVGIILLSSMIGSILITSRKRTGVKKQVIMNQNYKKIDSTLEIKKVNFNEGVDV